jgi:hypothetical protein
MVYIPWKVHQSRDKVPLISKESREIACASPLAAEKKAWNSDFWRNRQNVKLHVQLRPFKPRSTFLRTLILILTGITHTQLLIHTGITHTQLLIHTGITHTQLLIHTGIGANILQGFVTRCHSFFLFILLLYITYIHSIPFIQYIHPSSFAEVPLHLLIAGRLSIGKTSLGMPRRESNLWLPFSKPTHY